MCIVADHFIFVFTVYIRYYIGNWTPKQNVTELVIYDLASICLGMLDHLMLKGR